MKRILTLLFVVAVLALVGVSALANQRSDGRDERQKSVEIVMTEMRFSPNRIDARAGQSVLMTIVNRGSQRHDLAFPPTGLPNLPAVRDLWK